MSGKNPDEELTKALIRYERWVLLRFLKIELQREDHRSGNRKEPILYLTHTELLKISCSSMIVPGMSIDLMEDVLTKLEENDILSIHLVHSGSEQYVRRYSLTPKGNLRSMRDFGKILDYDDIMKLEYDDYSSNPKLKNIQEHIRELINKKYGSYFIRSMLINEYILSFPLTEIIKNLFGFKD